METLFSARKIQRKIKQLGTQITKDYQGQPVTLVCVLKGGFIFAADLARRIKLPVKIDFIGMKSYDGTDSTGSVQITHDLSFPVKNSNVLIIEDIIDTGLTSSYLLNLLSVREPKSIKLCSLLHKPSKTVKDVKIDYLGFTIEDLFVVGYGLDYNQECRNLPDIQVLNEY